MPITPFAKKGKSRASCTVFTQTVSGNDTATLNRQVKYNKIWTKKEN